MFSLEQIKEQAYKTAEKLLPYKSDVRAVQVAIDAVTGVVAVIIAILIGILIITKLSPQIVGTDATSNATINTTVQAAYGALAIASILPYVIVAGVAILLVVIYFSGRKAE